MRVETTDSERATAAMLARACDLAFVGKKPRDRRLTAQVFGSDEVVLVTRANDSFAPDGKLTLSQLAEVPLILREQGSGTRDAIARILPHLGEGGPALRVDSTEAAKRCVQHGLGLAFVSRQAIEAELAAKSFRVVELPGTPVRRAFYAVHQRSVTLSKAARELLDLAVQRNRQHASVDSG